MHKFSGPLVAPAVFLILSCTGCPIDPFGLSEEQIVIASYNMQNLFDDVSQGSEYPEYDPERGEWGREAYAAKLSSMAEIIRRLEPRPDIILVQEVENRAVLMRLAEEYLPLRDYDFTAVPEAEGAAVQTGVLSSLPFRNLLTHRAGGTPGERYILELEFDLEGEELVLFNCHWKSRLGGAEATEAERVLAAKLVARRIEELTRNRADLNVILAGDLNCDPYRPLRGTQPALAAVDSTPALAPVIWVVEPGEGYPQGSLCLSSGWKGIGAGGSYRYGGLWERIDHLLWNAPLNDGRGWDVVDFELWDAPLALDEWGAPLSFDAEGLTGYSDHLPLIIRLEKP